MVLFDATALSLLLHPGAKPPTDSAGQPVSKAQERMELLVKTLDEKKTKIIIPTPALAELLVVAGSAGPQYLNELTSRSCFKLVDFDLRAAIEVADQIGKALAAGDKRAGSESSWQKVKFDRQIVAIAKVENVTALYSDDEELRKYAEAVGIQAIGIEHLPLPQAEQTALFEKHETEEVKEPKTDSRN